jgi:DNA polymerase-3 subunit delta'
MMEAAFASGRLAHAYLFTGPRGTGKLSAALATAAAWMCEESRNCGACRHCRRIMSFQHPDVRVTIPATGSTTADEISGVFARRASDGITPLSIPGNCWISIESVREMQGRLAMKPFEGRNRAEIVVDADRMRAEAANALLKTLEEPPPGTLIILTAVRSSALLPTVRSRMQTVRFTRLAPGEIASCLEARLSLDPGEALRIARSSDGSMGGALMSAAEKESLPETASRAIEFVTRHSEAEVVEYSSDLARKLGTASSGRFCSGMIVLLHDMRRSAMGLDPLYHLASDLPDAASGWKADSLEEAGRAFASCEARLRANVMPQAALTAALLGARKVLADGNG